MLRGNKWLLALKIAVLITLLAFVLHGLDFKAIGAALRKFPPEIFAAAMGLQILMQVCQALRWKLLVGRKDIAYKDYLAFVSLGYAMALVSPSVLMSDSANAFMMGKRNQTIAGSISAMMAGRMLGMAAMLLIFLSAWPAHAWVLSKVPWQPRTSFFIGLAALIVGGLIAAWLTKRYGHRFREVVDQVRSVFTRPQALGFGLLLSVVVQGITLLVPWLGFQAMQIPIGLTDIQFFIPLITLLALAPVSIGQIGVREGLSIFFFTLLPGVTKEHLVASFGFGYALFAVMGLLNLAFAGWILRRKPPG